MYTQCQNCKAIFRVNMREVTVAQGKLRCGECDQVFNAADSLSTSIPTSYEDSVENNQSQSSLDDYNKSRLNNPSTSFTVKKVEEKNVKKRESIQINWLIVTAVLLLIFLLSQVFYNNRHFFLGIPLHQPEKIQMLNHNIFAHPNESGVLLISALIENTAEQAQPYPTLELRLKNSQAKLISLRRFLPREYLEKYNKNDLIPSKKPISLKLKIKDPGRNATHFQFEFL